jgi:diacylglycerol kinase (ATP)
MLPPTNKTCFIINPRSEARHPDIQSMIKRTFSAEGDACQIVRTSHRGDGTNLARQAVDSGFERVVAVGGDGLVNEVGTALVAQSSALGVVPCGSGNGFARALGISLDPETAIGSLLNATVRKLDVGQIGEDYFFSTAGLGMDAEVSNLYADHPRGRLGLLTFVRLSMRAMAKFTPNPTRVSIDGASTTLIHPLIFSLANTCQYGYGAEIAPDARPDDGLLDLCIIDMDQHGLNAWRKIKMLLHSWRLFNGSVSRIHGASLYRFESIEIETSSPGLYHVDGEPRKAPSRLIVKVLPASLSVLLPAA